MFKFNSISVKKKYYKLALKYHPDRVSSNDKQTATEKFNIIHQAYVILCDEQKRISYDKGSNVLFANATLTAKWEHFLKPITGDDLDGCRKKYQNSQQELHDIQREYIEGNGSMTHIINNVQFMRYEDETRVIDIIKALIADGVVPKLKIKRIK